MKWLKWLKYLIAFLVPVAGVMACNGMTIDNDSWDVLAEGREIVENGIYYEDQLSMHEGLSVTVQNYGFAAIFYLIYTAFGQVGLYVAMLLLNLLLCFLIYKICMLMSQKNVNLSLLIMVLTDLLLARWFVVTRAQMVSYCIMMAVIYLLELYVRGGKTKQLWWILVLSLLQINLHASLWPMLLFVTLAYIIDSIKCKKLHLQGYRTAPLIGVLVGTIITGFMNPYGIKMMTLMATSYGVPEANDYIVELHAFSVFSDNFNILLFAMIALTMILLIYGRKDRIRMRWLILIFGFLALGLNTMKGMSNLILVLMLPLAEVYRNLVIRREKYRKICWMAVSQIGVLAMCIIIIVPIVRLPEMIEGPNEEMVKAVDVLDKEISESNRKTAKVYTGFNQGGYIEYRGYKPYIDPRMEVFIKANNGKEDIFPEYYKLENGDTEEVDFLDKYNFEYLLVESHEKLFELPKEYDSKYEKIYETDANFEDDEYGVRVYKKI